MEGPPAADPPEPPAGEPSTRRPARDETGRLFERLPLCRAFAESVAADLLRGLPVVHPALDLACGDGQVGLSLSRGRFRFDAGAECDPAAARAAFRTGLYGRVTVGPLDRLPYPDGHFRTIVCAGPLDRSAPPDAVCREVARLLAPGGLFAVALPMAGAHGLRRRIRAAALAAAGVFAAGPRGASALVFAANAAGLVVTRRALSGGPLSGWLIALASLNLVKARVYARLLARPLPFPALHRRLIAPPALALRRLAGLFDPDTGEHLLLLARKPS